MNKVYVHNYNHRNGIDITSRSNTIGKQLSPFFLGPVDLYDGFTARNVENAWQYSKVYEEFIGPDFNPSPRYFEWAKKGWDNPRAVRYPFGKARQPLYSYWAGEQLSYVEARKKIYIPLYASKVVNTHAYKFLQRALERTDVHLRDFDGYDYIKLGMSLEDVVNCETRKMGHAFVIVMLLTGEYEKLIN